MVAVQRAVLLMGMKRRQVMVAAGELRRDDVLKVLEKCSRRGEAGIVHLGICKVKALLKKSFVFQPCYYGIARC